MFKKTCNVKKKKKKKKNSIRPLIPPATQAVIIQDF